ncbi:MAG: endonuclease MutS2 [Chloroflexota bacterium]|nr:endonuclease MutS2 [Chloroflexota bacterium]
MDSRLITKLELPAVLDRLSHRCRYSVASELARALVPATDTWTVQRALSLTGEAVALQTLHPELSVGGARDIRDAVRRAARGATLAPNDFLEIGDTLRASRTLRRAFFRLPDGEERFPGLWALVETIVEMTTLEADLDRSIGPRGDVLDTASPELGRLRREVRVAQNRLMDRLNGLISGGRFAAALQDAIVTMRDGRYVIPVRSDARGQIPGVVHDTSASGRTIFVEPFDVVELNNRWREHQVAEQHEIDRILLVLSGRVADEAEAFQGLVIALAEIDLLIAKALLSFDLRATRPAIWRGSPASTRGHPTNRVSLVEARHPLLDPATVVPTTVEIGSEYRVLLITGPNTGGKTVALKTIGLLCLMAQCGMFIPAADGSVLSVFPTMYADIGDEQSIEQSLSTFSAHMRTVIGMLAAVDRDSLVLLDELGAGTDPQEGSALARALISSLLERGPTVVATTHYSEVKAYAYATPGVENASVEFDIASLAPTYRLMVGVPGRSNALAIARRLGMPGDIVEAASGLLSEDDTRADALLEDIRARREEAAAAIVRAEQVEADARVLRMRAARELREAEQQRRTAREEALAGAEAELEMVRETLRHLERDRETVATTREHVEGRRREVSASVDTVRAFRRELQRRTVVAPRDAKPIRAGDTVFVQGLDLEGEVVAVSDGMADLQLGALKMRQPVAALERRGRASRPGVQATIRPREATEVVPIEIDIRGQRAHEVPDMLDAYLESAYRSGLPWVRIIHGKGTGALREVVRQHLHRHPVVEKYALAEQNQGGDGATVAYVKES